jgi:hypothetical protein
MQGMRWLLKRWDYVVPLAAGIILRIFYVLVTSYHVRGHDVGGHVEYVHFLLDHWVLPPPHGGFQFYQPPLYYFLCALIMKAAVQVIQDPEIGHRLLQWFALLLTFSSLGIAAWISHMLFPQPKESSQRFHFLALMAVIPGAVYFSAVINNDVLYLVFAFLSIALTLRWWRKPSPTTWLLLCNSLAIGLLIKTNSALLFFPVAASLLLQPRIGWLKKGLMGLAFFAIPFFVSAWFVLPPFFAEEDTRAAVVGNVSQMTGPISNDPTYLLTFDPLQVLANPFNAVSGDGSRRLYLWEFFFRSALFGEFSYASSLIPIAIVMLLAALVITIFAAYEGARDALRWRSSSTFPLWMFTGVILLGSLALRIAMPFSSSQDFRYAIGLLVPFFYYALARKSVTGRFWIWVQEAACFLFIAGSVAFLALLMTTPA